MKVAILVGDLMFASKALEIAKAAGHEVALNDATGADVAVVDLFDGWVDKPDLPAVAVYAHTNAEMRARAIEAGYDPVVPRSRFMREGAQLLTDCADRIP